MTPQVFLELKRSIQNEIDEYGKNGIYILEMAAIIRRMEIIEEDNIKMEKLKLLFNFEFDKLKKKTLESSWESLGELSILIGETFTCKEITCKFSLTLREQMLRNTKHRHLIK